MFGLTYVRSEQYEAAQAACQRGNFSLALELAFEALDIVPDDVDWNLVAGRSLVNLQRFDDALPYLDKVTHLDWGHGLASAWAWLHTAEAHAGQARLREAHNALQNIRACETSTNVMRRAEGLQQRIG